MFDKCLFMPKISRHHIEFGGQMRSFEELIEIDDNWTETADETASDIRSVLEWCPGEIKSRQLERSTPTIDSRRRTRLVAGYRVTDAL
jgi:hypothetical protein